MDAEAQEFTDCFNKSKGALAAFAYCENASDLALVKDGFMLTLGAALFPDMFASVKLAIIADEKVADAAGKGNAFQVQVVAARGADGWPALVAAVEAQAVHVGSDLAGIWGGLVRGRLEWIVARNATHMLKISLKKALIDGGGAEGDEMDAKMVWVYSLGVVLGTCKEHAVVWARKAGIALPAQPLKGFDQTKWDVRLHEWQTLDEAVGLAAERAGTSLEAEWELIGNRVQAPGAAAAAAAAEGVATSGSTTATAAADEHPPGTTTAVTRSPDDEIPTATTEALAAVSIDGAENEDEEEID